MLEALKFVQGAVAKKNLLPALTHFCIEAGTVRGYNGILALSSPIAFNIDCKPEALPMVRAIANCKGTVQLAQTANGRLSVRSGSFRALVNCVEGETAHVEPEGEDADVNGEALLRAFTALLPFVGNDASRPWSNGILMVGHSAYATNNTIGAQVWLGEKALPKAANIPLAAVREIVRVKQAPIRLQMGVGNITFHYEDGRWLRTQLLSTDWPDMDRIMDVDANPEPVHPQLFEAIETIKPFCDKMGRVFFREGKIITHREEGEGAQFELEGWNQEGAYNADMLLSLRDIATRIDFSPYPKPAVFYGDGLRGVIVGTLEI